jgi:phage protein D
MRSPPKKERRLLFTRRGTGITASGLAIPAATIRQSDTTEWEVSYTDRSKYRSAEARYRDVAAAEDRWVRSSIEVDVDTDAVFRLRRTYPDQHSAQAAADARLRTLVQGRGSLSLTMPGIPQIRAQYPIVLEDFDSRINGRWIVDQVEHRIDNGGFVSQISAPPPAL